MSDPNRQNGPTSLVDAAREVNRASTVIIHALAAPVVPLVRRLSRRLVQGGDDR